MHGKRQIHFYFNHLLVYLFRILIVRLSHHVKSSIIALCNAGLSWNEITNELNFKKSTVRLIVQKFAKQKSVLSKRSSGRPKQYAKASERRLIRIFNRNRNQCVKSILAQRANFSGNCKVNDTQVWNSVKTSIQKIALSCSMRKCRQQWCKERKLRSGE